MSEKFCPTVPEGLPATNEPTEGVLLQRLTATLSESDYLEALWQLALFYVELPSPDPAETTIKVMLEQTRDSAKPARCYHLMGVIAEGKRQYSAALEYYLKGLALNPQEVFTAYFLNNNAGYCLNLQGQHAEAERLCRVAIEIDSNRANAFKNLGISLAGQNDLLGAAWAWIEATKVDPRDSRALDLLQQLVAGHPEVVADFPGILGELEACKTAVEGALHGNKNAPNTRTEPIPTYEICRLKLTPGNGFSRSVNHTEQPITPEEIQRLYTEQALKMLGEYPGKWCAIVGERKESSTQAKKTRAKRMPKFNSRSEYLKWRRSLLPCLIFRGPLLEKSKDN